MWAAQSISDCGWLLVTKKYGSATTRDHLKNNISTKKTLCVGVVATQLWLPPTAPHCAGRNPSYGGGHSARLHDHLGNTILCNQLEDCLIACKFTSVKNRHDWDCHAKLLC